MQPVNRMFRFPLNSRWLIGLSIGSILLLGGGVAYFYRSLFTSPTLQSPIPTRIPIATKVNALGRLEPADRVIQVSASVNQGNSNRVSELKVKEGDRVEKGQIVAVLDSRDRLKASLTEAQQQVELARTQLAQVQAGAKSEEIAARQAAVTRLEAQLSGEIPAQQAAISRLEAELKSAATDLDRTQFLFREGAVSKSAVDTQQLALKTAKESLIEARSRSAQAIKTLEAQIQEARATLEQTIAVRPTDIAAAQARVNLAISNVDRLKVELESAFVRAPKSAQVLRIQTLVGETVGNTGILELGDTNQMIVVAEVFESDISKIRSGQIAVITSPTKVFSNTLRGTVEQIGLQIAKRDILDTDPTAATDARVVEVRIRLDKPSSQKVTGLTNLQVNVAIEL